MTREPDLRAADPEIADLVRAEAERQRDSIRLIASENYVSRAVLEATGTMLTNKYSEGYAGKRYYEGQQVIDQVETLAIERAKALFGVDHANVQPYSGSPANLAVYLAFLNPGDKVMGMALPAGGHLTHGWSVSATGRWFRFLCSSRRSVNASAIGWNSGSDPSVSRLIHASAGEAPRDALIIPTVTPSFSLSSLANR